MGPSHVYSFLFFLWLLYASYYGRIDHVTETTWPIKPKISNICSVSFYFLHTSLILYEEIRCMTMRPKILDRNISPGPHQCLATHPSHNFLEYVWNPSSFEGHTAKVWDCLSLWSQWNHTSTCNSQGQMVKSHSSQCECSCQKSNMSKNYSNCFFKFSEFL